VVAIAMYRKNALFRLCKGVFGEILLTLLKLQAKFYEKTYIDFNWNNKKHK
jgi:hypothetical protein